MSSSFGKWYEERKAEESGDNHNGNTWFSSEQVLPLFNNESMQSLSWSNLKTSMESQMPKQIMGMGYQQRFQVFCALLLLSALFFFLAFAVGVPMLAVHPHKFALSFTMGSLTFMASFGILKGPTEHLVSMFQWDRVYFTSIYLGSMFLTLYCTFSFGGASGYLLVIGASMVQMVALLWYLISFMPGGAMGLQYLFAALGHILKPVFMACARVQGFCLAKCLQWLTGRGS